MDTAVAKPKPWAVTEAKVEEAIQRLVAAAAPSRLILFGSGARGNWDSAQDLDLLVVKHKVEGRYAETLRLRRLLRDLLMPIDLVVTSESSFQERLLIPGTLEYNAFHEGRIVHEGH